MLLMGNKQDEQILLVRWGSHLITDVMHLHARLKPWLLGALQCVEEMPFGFGLFQLYLSMVQRGKIISPTHFYFQSYVYSGNWTCIWIPSGNWTCIWIPSAKDGSSSHLR